MLVRRIGRWPGASMTPITALASAMMWDPQSGPRRPISRRTKMAAPPLAPPAFPCAAGAHNEIHPFLLAHFLALGTWLGRTQVS
jgi:hypothetical protein